MLPQDTDQVSSEARETVFCPPTKHVLSFPWAKS